MPSDLQDTLARQVSRQSALTDLYLFCHHFSVTTDYIHEYLRVGGDVNRQSFPPDVDTFLTILSVLRTHTISKSASFLPAVKTAGTTLFSSCQPSSSSYQIRSICTLSPLSLILELASCLTLLPNLILGVLVISSVFSIDPSHCVEQSINKKTACSFQIGHKKQGTKNALCHYKLAFSNRGTLILWLSARN
jgi:hypothetical protein